jgi:WD40 repeat protein
MVVVHEPPELGPPVEDPEAEAEALFKEARRRTRRRRASRLALVASAVTAAIAICDLAIGAQPRSSASATPAPAVNRSAFAGHGDLAFISRGTLWVLDGASGALTPVTGPSQQASDPAFSPGGRWLSYGVANQTWLAHADGSSPRLISSGSGGGSWIAGDLLLVGEHLWRISAGEGLTHAGSASTGLFTPTTGEHRYIFVSSTLRVAPDRRPSAGVMRLEVSGSLNGGRTTWLQTPVSFTPQDGLSEPAFTFALALPKHAGILVGASTSCCDNADGVNLYEIRAAGAPRRSLGHTVGDTVSLGADGTFAFTRGGNRYAWLTKAVETCSTATERCTAVPTAAGVLSLDPAFSPNGRTLAFVEAAALDQTSIGQAQVLRWYATHSLWIRRDADATPARIAGTTGAAAPVWSADGRSLLYVADDALWLLPSLSGKPLRIAAPLFSPGAWPSFYGEVGWSGQFAWSTAAHS